MTKLFYSKPYDFFINKIKNDEHFKYSRFNDGELICIANKNSSGMNCDGHTFFSDMSKELKDIVLNYVYNDNYILETYIYWYNKLPKIKNILNNLKNENDSLTLINRDFIRMLHEQDPAKFIELLNILKEKKLVLIGPEYLSKLHKYFDFKHIEIPLKNCYLEKNAIIQSIKKINEVENSNVYLFSASMTTSVIIEFFKTDFDNTYIDWGSVWDTFFVSNEYNFIKRRSTSNNTTIKTKYKKYLI